MDEVEQKLNYIENNFLELAHKAQSITPDQAKEFEQLVSEKFKPFQKEIIEVTEKVSKVRELLHWIGGAVTFNTNPSVLRQGLLDLAPELSQTWSEAKAAFQRMQAIIGIEIPVTSNKSEDLDWLVVQTISGLEAIINGRDNGAILREVISRSRLAQKPLQARLRLKMGGRPRGLNATRLVIARKALEIWIENPNQSYQGICNQLVTSLKNLPDLTTIEHQMLTYLNNIPYDQRGSRLGKIIFDFRKFNKS